MSDNEISKVERKLKSVFAAETLNTLGMDTKMTERLRTVTPHRLALTLICTLATQKVETIADLQRAFIQITGKSLQYKPFYNQLAKPEFAEFMRQVLCLLLGELVIDVLRPKPGSPLSQFDDILLHDGSSFALSDALAGRFPGRFNKHSPAAVELHATMSLPRDAVVRVTLTPDTTSERSQLPDPLTLLRKLLIADRGYEDRPWFAKAIEAEASFLIRCKANANPIVENCWVDGAFVPQFKGPFKSFRDKIKGQNADLQVRYRHEGKDVRYRMVLVWNPVHRSHMMLATNLKMDDFEVAEIRKLYAVRWQIELAFKEWKSYANLRKFNTENASIAQGLIWAALAAALLKRFLAHAAQRVHGIAISTRTTAMCVGDHVRELIYAALTNLPLIVILRSTMLFLATAARRAHKARDALSARLSAGFEAMFVGACL